MDNIIVETNKKKVNKFGLALGGGGTKGLALIGAIKAFEEAGIKFDYVAGTSVGALIGAFYCAGISADKMLEYALNLKEKEIKTSKIPLTPSKTDGLEEVIKRYLGDIQFDELKIPFCAVAVDIKTGEEVHLTKGSLVKAIAGSCAVPAVFQPVEFENYLLFDGGLQNTIPANVPKLNNCEITIGIDVNSSRGQGTDSTNYFKLLGQAISVMMKSNAIKGYLNADLMIKPNMKRFKNSSLDGAREMFEEGYKATKEKIQEIKDLFAKRKPKRNIFKFLYFWKNSNKTKDNVEIIENEKSNTLSEEFPQIELFNNKDDK